MPRINRCIELLEGGQPIYYGSPALSSSAGHGMYVVEDLTYENGLANSATTVDYLSIDFEHAPFDMGGLQAFMKGLRDGGPTRSGHATPTVIATLPSSGRSADMVLLNQWQITHLLNTGVHGLILCHVSDPAAVRAFVQCCRFAYRGLGNGDVLGPGRRGSGGQLFPADIWGLSPEEYMHSADPWPLSSDGELMLGLKIEDRECLVYADQLVSVPGVAFAEWGPGDMGMSYGNAVGHDPPYSGEMMDAMQLVKGAIQSVGLPFLSGWNDPALTVAERARYQIEELGVKIIATGGVESEELMMAGRKLTNRQMPV